MPASRDSMLGGIMGRYISAALAAATISFAFISSATAADMPIKARSFAPVPFTWSGYYAGINVGYGFSSTTTDVLGTNPAGVVRQSLLIPGSENRTGFLGGVQLGLNFQSGNIVYGLETDLSGGRVRGSADGPVVAILLPLAQVTSTETKLDWLGTFRGRLGASFDRSLIYATGGLAYGRATSTVSSVTVNNGACTLLANLCIGGSAQKWMVGWTLGAGWEYAVSGPWSAKLEYLYYDLGTINNDGLPLTNGVASVTFGSSTRVSGNIVRLGLNYKLGGM